MICQRCGCSFDEDITACPMCGALVAETEPSEQSSTTVEIPACESLQAESEPLAPPVQYAGFWIRFWAKMLDGLVLACFSLAIYGIGMFMAQDASLTLEESTRVLFVPQVLMEAFYFIYFHAVTGQTVGKRAFGLKVVRENGKPIGWSRSLIRYIGTFVSSILLALGYIWIAFDSRKQAWHDKMAGSFVIKVTP